MKGTHDTDFYVEIFRKLREKYYGKYPEKIIQIAAKQAYKWLLGVSNMIKNEKLKEEVRFELFEKAVKVGEVWMEKWIKEMFE